MAQVKPITLENGHIVYIETIDELEVSELESQTEPVPAKRGMGEVQEQIVEGALSMSDTISAYADYTLSALRKVAMANVEEVTLQFGIEVGGEAGIPYITKGTAKGNLNVTVKCSFPPEKNSQSTDSNENESEVGS